jgi:hypothetical protein
MSVEEESFQSKFDPERETVGKIYRDAQINNSAEGLKVGDINKEMVKSFVDDLNEAIASNPFNGVPFYIQVAEKLDLQMKKAIRRMVNKTLYRPWPEDGTTVFWTDPSSQQVRFCWDIPHVSEMKNILANPYLYPHQYPTCKAWDKFEKTGKLDFFGFFTTKVFNNDKLKYEDHCFPLEFAHLKDMVLS